MALEYKTPVPVAPHRDEDLRVWLTRFVAWLKTQEGADLENYEELLALSGSLGGIGAAVANRIFSSEGEHTIVSPPESFEILPAPAAGKKRIMVSTEVITSALGTDGYIYKLKGATEHLFRVLITGATQISGASRKGGVIRGVHAFDATDESMRVMVTAGSGTVSYIVTYLDTD